MTKKTASQSLVLPQIKIVDEAIYLVGTAPLVLHAFSEKARKEMLDKQMKVPRAGRDARDPAAEFEASRFRLKDGRDGIPAISFKTAAVTACTSLSDITKVAARQALMVFGEPMESAGALGGSLMRTQLVPLVAGPPALREDVVRLAGPGRKAETRYRPEYWPWGVELSVRYNQAVLSQGQLWMMFRAAGMVGVGEYRPQNNGDCGTFDVADEQQFATFRDELARREAA